MFSFFAQILSSDSQQGSFSRFTGLLIVMALIVWASVIVLAQKAIPDIPYYWLVLVLGLYGINKVMEGAKIIAPLVKGDGNGSDQPEKQG